MTDQSNTTNPSALLALAERCEREEPSRLLDVQIGSLIREGEIISPGRLPRDTGADFDPMESVWPRYTTSLDAAVLLVPEPARFALEYGPPEGIAATVYPNWDEDPFQKKCAFAASLALALCAAALKARALTKPEGE